MSGDQSEIAAGDKENFAHPGPAASSNAADCYACLYSRAIRAKRASDLARPFAASTARSRGGALVTSESISSRTEALISSIALLKAASFACEGLVNPLTFRTN